jgi:3-deoxy-D-manno-octulosonic-acid transferase
VIAGSTHPGEEEIALDGLPPGALLVLAPRDVRRAGAVEAAVRARGLAAVAFSRADGESLAAARVMVLDVLGELPRLYEGARVAFIGGSFDGSGGHNFLEAARFAVPVVCGPRMRNFADDVAGFLRRGAIVQAPDAAGVGRELAALLGDPERARRIGESGAVLLHEHRGAAARTAAAIRAVAEARGTRP